MRSLQAEARAVAGRTEGLNMPTVTILSKFRERKTARRRWMCRCRCICEKQFTSRLDHVLSGATTSCGCVQKRCSGDSAKQRIAAGWRPRLLHGMTGTPEYRAYYLAKNRCQNPKCDKWKYYGGRGIKFLFVSFEQWFKEIGLRPTSDHSIDRENPDGNYEPGNIRWATTLEQRNNRSSSLQVDKAEVML